MEKEKQRERDEWVLGGRSGEYEERDTIAGDERLTTVAKPAAAMICCPQGTEVSAGATFCEWLGKWTTVHTELN